jgi:FG-GAP-like repeat
MIRLRSAAEVRSAPTRRRRWNAPLFGALLGLSILLASPGARGQSRIPDEGHCALGGKGKIVVACWNFAAGNGMPVDYSTYPERLPFLRGWDFRINLPHVRFQRATSDLGSAPAFAGVIEDATPLSGQGTMSMYGHKSNSLWIFRVAGDKHAYYKVLPSRRDPESAAVANVTSLTSGWIRMGPDDAPLLRLEKPAVAVIGEGLGDDDEEETTTLIVVARGEDDVLYSTTRRLNGANFGAWPSAWQGLGRSDSRPALAAAFSDSAALAWHDPVTDIVRIRMFDAAASTWSGGATPPDSFSAGEPVLVMTPDGLNLLFVGRSGARLMRARATSSAFNFSQPEPVSPTPVRPGSVAGVSFNQRLHVVYGDAGGTGQIWYTVARPSDWTPRSYTGLRTNTAPQIVSFYDQLFVIAAAADGTLRYARKDPNSSGPDASESPVPALWLGAGLRVDPGTAGDYSAGFDALSFNNDVYLAAQEGSANTNHRGLHVLNFSRAAMKQLMVGKWGIKLNWGRPGGGDPVKIRTASGDQVAFGKDSVVVGGDINGDRADELIRFTQRARNGVGPAPVDVAMNDPADNPDKGWRSSVWHTFFSLKGEVPLVGDFNGDGKDDIVTFVQKQQKYANGTPIGPAPVWVSLSNGSRFGTSRIWHTFFSLKGEVPLVGDFNGDGKDDIVTFVQKQQKSANGTPIGPAPVWVSLSNGSRFGTSRIWHTFFSLKGEVPLVGDFDLNGRDDIATFLHDRVSGPAGRSVYVASSTGSSFSRSTTWHSDFAKKTETPVIVSLGPLSAITKDDADRKIAIPDLMAFDRSSGSVHLVETMLGLPYPSGAPWERYKWFPEKGLGVAQYPEWVYARASHCLQPGYRFNLGGAGGSGGGIEANLSVRRGSRAGHVIQEFGHTLFANCFRKQTDPMHDGIYGSEGIGAQDLWGGGPMRSLDCPVGTTGGPESAETYSVPRPNGDGASHAFYDCRPDVAEHYFLALLVHYRLDGEQFRRLIDTAATPARRARLKKQYGWLKDKWFAGTEFRRGTASGASYGADGVQCLIGEC